MQDKTNYQVNAGFFVRLAAYLIDSLIVGVALLFVRLPLWVFGMVNPNNFLDKNFLFQYSIKDIVFYALGVGYYVLMTYKTGTTLGKKLLHLKVVSVEDREPTFFEILYRETVGRFLSMLIAGVGYLMVGASKEKRGLHDRLSDTKVVYAFEKEVPIPTPVVEKKVANTYAPTSYVQQPTGKKSSKLIHRNLDQYAAILKSRLLERIPSEKLQPIEIELLIQPELGVSESYQIKKDGERWKIIGMDGLGLFYGIGKFLHSAKWTETEIIPLETEGVISPNSTFRAIYFAVHFYNWYQMAPTEELVRYVEDLLLYGYNTIVSIIPIVNMETFEDELFKQSVEKTRTLYEIAKKYGMQVGVIINPNQGIKSSPEEFAADVGFDPSGIVRPHFGMNICPAKDGAIEHLKYVWNNMLEQYKEIGIDYLLTWPYDEGGCGCETCSPWGARGYGDLLLALREEVVKYYPDAKFVVSTWLFDMPDDQKEYEGFYQRLQGDLAWIDYIMVDNVHEFPKYPLEHEVIKPIVNFPEISMWKMWPWGGRGANPVPARFHRLWNETKHILSGGMPYSEGMFEDISKVQCVAYYWDAGREYQDILREYANYEFGSEYAEDALWIMETLGDCHLKLAEKIEPDLDKVMKCAELAKELDEKMDARAKSSWRWRILYIRTQLDKILCETYMERDRGDIEGIRRIRDTANVYLDNNEEAQAYLQELCKLYHCVSENGENRYTRPPVKDGIVKE